MIFIFISIDVKVSIDNHMKMGVFVIKFSILSYSQNLQVGDNSLNNLCKLLTFSQTSPGFHLSAVQVFWKHCGERKNCS